MARLCFKEDKHRYAKAQRANKSHSSFGKYVVFFLKGLKMFVAVSSV